MNKRRERRREPESQGIGGYFWPMLLSAMAGAAVMWMVMSEGTGIIEPQNRSARIAKICRLGFVGRLIFLSMNSLHDLRSWNNGNEVRDQRVQSQTERHFGI